MDPHRVGPSIGTVLTRQPMHRSSLLWDALLAGEEVPGVLTCCHRDKGLFDGGLDPRIATYITDAGLDGLLRVPHMDLDHALITALVERWRPETHSFHLPHGEMTITLQDIEVPPSPPDRPVGTKKNTAVLEGSRIKAKWLEEQFRNPLPADATEVRVQQHLCKASEKTAKQIGGALLLVQLWAWARFPQICPVMRHPHQALPPGPFAVRWKGANITTDHPMHVLRAYRVSLASLWPNQEPYRDYLGSLPAYCTAGQHIWRSIVPFIHFWVVEGHHPERVLRQFGMKQGVPDNVDTSIELHKITLQGKHEKNWVQEHATHIARWVVHATIAEAPPFHGLRIMAKFEPGSEIYTDCMNALQSVKKISRLTLDGARTVGNASEPAVGRGRQAGGR
ncbi:serine/threonine-protein phosphatase 7 long form homolog [Castanea sativa]|uniref:serine/threonine-protein phosphatase 7 long form homolog n=1 Tax=Castanea sativa TaxID=21020 RepID=UPI003F651021